MLIWCAHLPNTTMIWTNIPQRTIVYQNGALQGVDWCIAAFVDQVYCLIVHCSMLRIWYAKKSHHIGDCNEELVQYYAHDDATTWKRLPYHSSFVGETTCHLSIPVTMGLWPVSMNKLRSKQWIGRLFETPWCSYDITYIEFGVAYDIFNMESSL